MEQNFETCLYNVVDAAKIQKDEPMKKHTTFRIGGPADYRGRRPCRIIWK